MLISFAVEGFMAKKIHGPDAEVTKRVTALLAPEEFAAAELLRRLDGRTLSAYIRRLIQVEMAAALKAKRITQAGIASIAVTVKKEIEKAQT